ncbi:MAG: glycosyltransferase 87 family protein [Ruthenibacterium sp.]
MQLFFYAAMVLLLGCFLGLLARDFAGNQAGIFYRKGERLFEDYVRVAKYSATRNPYFDDTNGFAEHAYPPFVYCLFWALSKFADFANPALDAYGAGHTLLCLVEISLLTTLCTLVLFLVLYEMNKNAKLHQVLLTLCLFGSGIFITSYERGNVIFLSVIMTSLYLLLYSAENKILREIGFLSLAVAAAIKCFPAVFGLLLLYEKRWKEAARLAVYGVMAFFVPFLFLRGGLANLPQWVANLKVFGRDYLYQTAFGWQGLMRYVPEAVRGIFALLCKAVTLLLMAGCALCGLFQKTAWKRITFLACIQILFPSVSHIYCGLYLLPCVVLFFNDALIEKRNWGYTALFVGILSPLQWVAGDNNFTYSVVNVLVMLLFFALCLENGAAAYHAFAKKRTTAAVSAGTE